MRKRYSQRFTKRLEVAFSSGESKYTAISSDLSASGLFIRTQHGLSPGSEIDIEVYLPDAKVGQLKGIVRRTIKTSFSLIKNGMGVEIIGSNSHYLDFLKTVGIDTSEDNAASPDIAPPREETAVSIHKGEENPDRILEYVLITCDNCKVKNRVRIDRLPFGPRCGKCGTALNTKATG